MEKAFLRVIEENQKIIYKVTRMYRDTTEDQEDLFQEIVYQLWKAFPGFRNESKITTWMYRIALNTAIARFRGNCLAMEYNAELPDKIHQEASEISDNEERMFLALRKLDTAERAIISLFLEDYSYKEIAEVIGISENYVGVRINRIKLKLRKILI